MLLQLGYTALAVAVIRTSHLVLSLMLRNEGPKNLFRILQCRDIDMDSLQGILVDHACLVDPYILNHEAEMLQ